MCVCRSVGESAFSCGLSTSSRPTYRDCRGMISPSMWVFLILAPLVLLIAARASCTRSRTVRSVSQMASWRLRLWRICCAALAVVVLVWHLILPHPDGADFEGLRALRFFTLWCFCGSTLLFVVGAVHSFSRSFTPSREEALFYTFAPLSLLVDLLFWIVIFPLLPERLKDHAFRFDELTMHAINMPILLLDSALLTPEARAGRAAGLWLRPVTFAASYLAFHWGWIAAGGEPVYEFLRPSLPWAGAIHAALLALIVCCFHVFRLIALARSWCHARGPDATELMANPRAQEAGMAIDAESAL